MKSLIESGEIVNNRYRLLQTLKEDNFSRTYLAEDNDRLNERRLIKEFPLAFAGVDDRQQAKELLEKETERLSGLRHPQITRFRELFQERREGQSCLFWVQDYVEGKSYRDLLDNRRLQGVVFSELEVILLLVQLLPVLEAIHALGIVHQNVCPENIVLRSSDGLPVLVNCSAVKQFAQIQLAQPSSLEQVAPYQLGYAPLEQLEGKVSPHADLYALAVTALVLLTHQESHQLSESDTIAWDWQREIVLSSQLRELLEQMLAQSPHERLQSAVEVKRRLDKMLPQPSSSQPFRWGALQARAISSAPAPAQPSSETAATVVMPLTTMKTPLPEPARASALTTDFLLGCLTKLALLVAIVVGSGTLGWVAGKVWLQQSAQPDTSPSANAPSTVFSNREQQEKVELGRRRQELGIDNRFFASLVDWAFGEQYPAQQGKALTSSPEDVKWRDRWDKLAFEYLNRLSFLSLEARQGLGNYTQTQRDRWKYAVNRLNLSSRALYDLADAEFFYRFPEQEDRNLTDEPIGQVWHAIVFDKLKTMQSGTAYEKISLAGDREIRRSEALQPGEGQAYAIQLAASRFLRVKLDAKGDARLSLYSPTGQVKLLEDSPLNRWSGILPETGFYEFVVVSEAEKPFNYRLSITVDD